VRKRPLIWGDLSYGYAQPGALGATRVILDAERVARGETKTPPRGQRGFVWSFLPPLRVLRGRVVF